MEERTQTLLHSLLFDAAKEGARAFFKEYVDDFKEQLQGIIAEEIEKVTCLSRDNRRQPSKESNAIQGGKEDSQSEEPEKTRIKKEKTAIMEMLMAMPMESLKKFKGRNLTDATTIRNIAARLNQDFNRRLWKGHETTFTVKITPNKKKRNYTVEVLRYPGRLEKKGGKYIIPVPAVTLL